MDYLPRKGDDDCLMELRWLSDLRPAGSGGGGADLAAWLGNGPRRPKLCLRVEENIDSTLSFYRLPREHHKHLHRPTCRSG